MKTLGAPTEPPCRQLLLPAAPCRVGRRNSRTATSSRPSSYRVRRWPAHPDDSSCRREPMPLHRTGYGRPARGGPRSEEHTSELQSRENLVCRLLLEKKKKKRTGSRGGGRGGGTAVP